LHVLDLPLLKRQFKVVSERLRPTKNYRGSAFSAAMIARTRVIAESIKLLETNTDAGMDSDESRKEELWNERTMQQFPRCVSGSLFSPLLPPPSSLSIIRPNARIVEVIRMKVARGPARPNRKESHRLPIGETWGIIDNRGRADVHLSI